MSDHTIILDETNFTEEVLNSDVPVLVDFWAEWCGPCRAIALTVHDLATEYHGKAKVGQVNVDANQDLAAEYGVRSIPTLLFIQNGQEVDRVIGQVPRDVLESKLKSLAA